MKNNDFSLKFKVRKFKDLNYESLDIGKYKKEIKYVYHLFIEKYYNEKNIKGLKKIKEELERELLCRDNCENEITGAFKRYLGEAKSYLSNLEFKHLSDDDFLKLLIY